MLLKLHRLRLSENFVCNNNFNQCNNHLFKCFFCLFFDHCIHSKYMCVLIRIKSQRPTERGNKFISTLSHEQKESIYSLQTTDQVHEANGLLHRVNAYSSILQKHCTTDNQLSCVSSGVNQQ